MRGEGRGEKYLGAVDLGGSKILSVAARADGHRLAEDRRPTGARDGPDVVLERIVASLKAALAAAHLRPDALAAVGVCSAGFCDTEAGVIRVALNLPGWRDVPIVRFLEERLGIPAILENDGIAGTLGEHIYGAGRGCRQMVYLTVGTGIGGGLIIDGKLHRGVTGPAAIIGHISVDPNGPQCGCGNRGCLEALASGQAIAAQAEEAVAQGESPLLAILSQEEGELNAETVLRAAQEGDTASQAIIQRAGHYLGIGLATYANLFNPEAIIVGGGLIKLGELYLGSARAEMEARAMREPLKALRLTLAELGDYAGVAGLVALLHQRTTL